MRHVIVPALLLVAGAALALPALGDEVVLSVTDATAHEGHAQVKGTITHVDEANRSLVLDEVLTVHALTLPVGIEVGRTILAEGTVAHTTDGPVLDADHLQVGCPSRYDAAA